MHKILLMIFSVFVLTSFVSAEEPRFRDLEFSYEVMFKNIPEGAKELKVWMPVLPETEYQKIEEVKIEPENLGEISYDSVYKNKIFSFTLKAPFDLKNPIKVQYKVKRLEYVNKQELAQISEGNNQDQDLEKFLQPNQLGKLTEEYKVKSLEITKNQKTTMAKARAIYDYIFENVVYNKEVPGWGQGDTPRVCNLKSGNCTDFHSLFISMARENKIPAKFVIGVPFKSNVSQGQVAGYHCWAEFYDETLGWVPVDISEASKDKSKYEYHFGAIDENRLEFSKGRDIVLEPQQQGEPLNYFIYPYAELDGKEFKGIGVRFMFKDSNKSISRITSSRLNKSLGFIKRSTKN